MFVFYAEEDIRGKWAWEHCKRQLQAKGQSLDWDSYIPAPVDPAKNFYAAPNMTAWFVGWGKNDFSRKLALEKLGEFLSAKYGRSPLAQVKIVPFNANIPASDADLVLEFEPPLVAVGTVGARNVSPGTSPSIIPLIAMDEVALTDAITNLANQEQLRVEVDPKALRSMSDEEGKWRPEAVITGRWTNYTAHRALMELLIKNNLELTPDPTNGGVRVMVAEEPSSVAVGAAASEELSSVIKKLTDPVIKGEKTVGLPPAIGPPLFAGPLAPMTPIRITIRAETPPTMTQLAGFFPMKVFPSAAYSLTPVDVENAGSNDFNIFVNDPIAVSASDFLAWTSEFEGDFELIREALKRPYARMDGDYSEPLLSPTISFMTFVGITRTLAERVQCHLLLGNPNSALNDLTLFHHVRQLLEARPEGKPAATISAIVNDGEASIYARVIADGLRLRAWREQDLVVIQGQLEQIDLIKGRVRSLEFEQAGSCRTLEVFKDGARRGKDSWLSPRGRSNPWRGPFFSFDTVAPEGWYYQNMVTVVTLEQKGIEGFDVSNGIVHVDKIELAQKGIDALTNHSTPNNWIANIFTSPMSRAAQTSARFQTLVNEALIACGLERYHLAHGEYPETLGALAPQFLGKIPNDIIGGQPLKYRREGKAFVLYSVGWNGLDDGGVPSPEVKGREDFTKGDWVWR